MRKLVGPIIIILIILLPVLWYRSSISSLNSNDKSSQIFVVQKGEGVSSIASRLAKAKLIKSAKAFELLTKFENLASSIQAGDFRLSPSMTSEQIAKDLTHGNLDIWVTITEGKRADEIAQILQDKMPLYNDSWKTQLEQNEGYLFPDTYNFPREATISDIIQILTSNFEKKYEVAMQNQTSKLIKQQIVILASLVEREGRSDADRPEIASVFYNRLNLGMALQVDATIQYAIGTPQNFWPTLEDTGNNIAPGSVYNSYTHVGLPPTPICNPGQKALEAALNPAQSDYLYYFADKHGVTHFAKTLAQQNSNIQKYGL